MPSFLRLDLYNCLFLTSFPNYSAPSKAMKCIWSYNYPTWKYLIKLIANHLKIGSRLFYHTERSLMIWSPSAFQPPHCVHSVFLPCQTICNCSNRSSFTFLYFTCYPWLLYYFLPCILQIKFWSLNWQVSTTKRLLSLYSSPPCILNTYQAIGHHLPWVLVCPPITGNTLYSTMFICLTFL